MPFAIHCIDRVSHLYASLRVSYSHNLCVDRFGAPWPGEDKPLHGEVQFLNLPSFTERYLSSMIMPVRFILILIS